MNLFTYTSPVLGIRELSFLKSLAKTAKHFNIILKTIDSSWIPLPLRAQYQSKEPSSPPALSVAAVPTEIFAEDYWHCTANINQLLFCLHTQRARPNASTSTHFTVFTTQ